MSEQKKSRYTIEISPEHQAKLAATAKQHKLSQGEVIEVLLELIDPAVHDPALAKRREEKVVERTAKRAAEAPKKEVLAKFKSLSPEQQAALLANIQ
ncbi:hypothetical protein [Herbaspirillum huttiense]|uniref:Ribbon-helix-helix CopG family protein n=1 Tax=Herbaspirillum huttiense subsp. lycopersici TaxID=3074428 RepID=A0ABU2EGN2_9BURK|nr:hypothetical protein [Herbaspirillum huttiense]MDR9847040.1 hypothetical protein [Herbaspirillum huttiense SE1]